MVILVMEKTLEEILDELQNGNASTGGEDGHMEADELLLEAINVMKSYLPKEKETIASDIIQAYNKIPHMWYA